MKSQFFQFLFALGAVGVLASSSQAASYKVVADIPFPFHVGAQTFQPGKYIVEKPQMSEVEYLTSVSTGEKVAALLGRNETEQVGRARLVFRDYGDSKFLADVWTVDRVGTKLPVSKAERAEHERAQSSEVPMSLAGTK